MQFYYQDAVPEGPEEMRISLPQVLRVQVEFFLHSYYIQGIKPDRRVPYSVIKATENSACWQIYSTQLKDLGTLNRYSDLFGRVEQFQGEEFGNMIHALEKENVFLKEEINKLREDMKIIQSSAQMTGAIIPVDPDYNRETIKFPPGKLGMTFDLFSGKIVRVVPGGAAESEGVQRGWILITINNAPFSKDRLLSMDFKASNKLTFDIPRFTDKRRRSSVTKRQPGAGEEYFDADEELQKRLELLENEVKIARRQSMDVMKQGIQIKNKIDTHEAVVKSNVEKLQVAIETVNPPDPQVVPVSPPSEQLIKDVKQVVETKHVNLEQDIEELQLENTRLRAAIDNLRQENLDAKQKFALLRNQIDKVKSTPLSPTPDSISIEIEKHADMLFRRQSVDFQENIETIVKEGEALQEYVETTNTNVQEDIISLQLQNERLRTLVQSTQQDCLHTKQQLAVLRQQIEKLREQLGRIEKSTRGMSMFGAMMPWSHHEPSSGSSDGNVGELQSKLSTLEDGHQTLLKNYKLFESGIQEEVNTQTSEIEELQKRLDLVEINLTQDVRRLSLDHTEVKTHNDRLVLEVEGTKQKSNNLRQQISKTKDAQKAFEDKITSVLFQLKRQVDTINETLDRYDERESELEEFVQATEERHNSLRMDSNEMKGELEKLVVDIAANQSPPAGDLDAKIEKLENMLLEKEHENENLKQHNIMLAQQMEAKIEERMKQVEAELEKKILALLPQIGGGAFDNLPDK